MKSVNQENDGHEEEQHLQQVSATTKDEDEQLFVDEDLMKLEFIFKDMQTAAKEDWGMAPE